MEDVSAAARQERHLTHGPMYGSQSHLMPEYHTNPYYAAAPNVVPVKHLKLAPYSADTLGRPPEGMETRVLSQPASMYDPHSGIGGAYAMGGARHAPGVPMGYEYGHAPMYQSAGPMPYGLGTIYGTTSRRKRKKKTRSVSMDSEDQFPNLSSALSQPDFANPGVFSQPNAAPSDAFYGGGGGSMRHLPPSHHAWRRRSSQYDQQLEEGFPPHTAAGSGSAHHYPRGNRPNSSIVVLSEDTDGADKRGGAIAGEAAQEGEELPVEWEVRGRELEQHFIISVDLFNVVVVCGFILEFNNLGTKETEGWDILCC